MFDMSWGEIMLIGGVALVVIGPKDLPRALRTVGQVTGKLKRMAGEFQVQFNEAMREAELDEARREVEGLHRPGANVPGHARHEALEGWLAALGRPWQRQGLALPVQEGGVRDPAREDPAGP